MSYCDYVKTLAQGNVHRIYHDQFYGVDITDDNDLFERLILEINQAGLSWNTILNKQANFRRAYSNFNIKKVAQYGAPDRARLLADAGIIRNRLKVDAAIYNAGVILGLQREYGSFHKWLLINNDKIKGELVPLKVGGEPDPSLCLMGWVKLFKKTFHFTGGEIVNEFLMSIGLLPGAHTKSCKYYK